MLKSAPISSVNELLAPYVVIIMTNNLLSYQIGAAFEINIFILKLISQHIFVDNGAFNTWNLSIIYHF